MTGGRAVGAAKIPLDVQGQRRRGGADAYLAVIAHGQLGAELVAGIERSDGEPIRPRARFADHELQTRSGAVHAIDRQRSAIVTAGAIPEIELVIEKPQIAFDPQIAFNPYEVI